MERENDLVGGLCNDTRPSEFFLVMERGLNTY
jgi:hypothetical protein